MSKKAICQAFVVKVTIVCTELEKQETRYLIYRM